MVETRHQTQLLTLLRDEGPMSRVELGERLERRGRGWGPR